jgi:hypothetical protein
MVADSTNEFAGCDPLREIAGPQAPAPGPVEEMSGPPRKELRTELRTWTATITGTGEIGTIPAIPGDTIKWDTGGEPKHFLSIWVPDEHVFGERVIADKEEAPVVRPILEDVPQGTPGRTRRSRSPSPSATRGRR